MEVGSHIAYLDGTTLMAVPSGTFVMGHGQAANPEHNITLSDFWIYATEVTNRQYALCVSQGVCSQPNLLDDLNYSEFSSQNLPVVGVIYDQAQSYCNYVNGDLPTEAQWEKAARGPDNSLYPWGNADPSCDLLNFNNCVKQSTDVMNYNRGKSYYGALGMEGNVYEWVFDWYDPLYYRNSPPGDPAGPDSGSARVIRSSGYRSNAVQSLSYARSFTTPQDHRRDLGFRCAIKDPTYFAPACRVAAVIKSVDKASLIVDCPKISVDVQPKDCRYGGGAIVTFNDDHANDPNASFGGIVGCTLLSGTPGSFPLSYQCKTASSALMSSSCTYSGITNTACGAHYNLNPETGFCEWDGNRSGGIECSTGNFYDPIHHCCAIPSGSAVDTTICPVGTIMTEQADTHFVCLPAENALAVPEHVVGINPPVCANACNLSPESCSVRNLIFCSTNCTCLSAGIKCPTK